MPLLKLSLITLACCSVFIYSTAQQSTAEDSARKLYTAFNDAENEGAKLELVKHELKHRVDKNTEIPYTAYTYDVKYISPQVQYKTGTV